MPELKPLEIRKDKLKPPETCPLCLGREIVKCNLCHGSGEMPKTGFGKKNRLNMSKIVGSRWTACRTREGHRHFEVINRKGKASQKAYFEMTNLCGEESVSFWVPAEEIKDKKEWRHGWVTLMEIEAGMEDRRSCVKCKGACVIECPQCEGMGVIGIYDFS